MVIVDKVKHKLSGFGGAPYINIQLIHHVNNELRLAIEVIQDRIEICICLHGPVMVF